MSTLTEVTGPDYNQHDQHGDQDNLNEESQHHAPKCMGARVRELRLRYCLSLADVCAATGFTSSFLNRLEAGRASTDQLKPATFHLVLDAIGVTVQEREAVFHRDPAPLPMTQIREEVTKAARLFEDATTPTALLDDRWNWWYVNRSGRLLFGLTGEEYSRLLGSHTLCHLVDPSSPMYGRCSNEMRRIYFSWKVASFKFHCAGQEFSSWYRTVASVVSQVEWAARIWSKPLILPTLLDSHEVTLSHPTAGELHLRDQLNLHMRSPRFRLLEWTPTDEITALKASALSSPEEWFPTSIRDAGVDSVEEQAGEDTMSTTTYRRSHRHKLPASAQAQLQPCPGCQQLIMVSRSGRLLN